MPPPQDRTRRLRHATLAVLGLAVLFSLVRTVGKDEDFQDLDFGAYHRAGVAAARGGPVYAIDRHGPTGSFVYAPAYAYFFVPLGRLDYLWACRLWTLLNWTFAASCVVLALRLVRAEGWGPNGAWVRVWLVLVPLGGYFWSNVRAGQAGALLTALCLGWAVCRRCGRPFAGGLLLAAAAALKLAPALLLPYLLVRRDWRGLAGAAVGGLLLVAVPVPSLGWQGAIRLHVDWVRHCRDTQIASQTCRTENQSLLGELARLPAISDGQTCYSPDRLRNLERAYPYLVLVLAGLGYAALFWHVRRVGPEMERHGENLQFSLLMIFLTLAHPRAWGCNFVALTPAAVLLADVVCRRAPGRRAALGSLVLAAVVCAAPKSGPSAGWSWLRWAHQGKDFWAAAAMAGACGWAYARAAAPESSRTQQGPAEHRSQAA